MFLASPFCDARDVVQVEYEMVRRVRGEKVPVAQGARAFGHRRQAVYEIAAALDAGGPGTVVSGKPGPKGPTKLTDEVMGSVDAWRSTEPAIAAWQLAARLRDEVGLVVHPRSIERALVRRREPQGAGGEVPVARRAARPFRTHSLRRFVSLDELAAAIGPQPSTPSSRPMTNTTPGPTAGPTTAAHSKPHEPPKDQSGAALLLEEHFRIVRRGAVQQRTVAPLQRLVEERRHVLAGDLHPAFR